MKSSVDQLKALVAKPLTDEDGEPYEVQLLSGVAAAELRDYEARHGLHLSETTKDLLRFSRGVAGGALEILDFLGQPFDAYLGLKPKPSLLEIAQDGWGNSWFYDFAPGATTLGPIFYYCHEGPIITYQCADLAAFITDFILFMKPPYKSPIDDIHEFRVKPIDQLNSDLIPVPEAALSEDALLRAFAARFADDQFVYDFRGKAPGFGFNLNGLKLLAKHHEAPIYAFQTRPSLLQKLTAFWRK